MDRRYSSRLMLKNVIPCYPNTNPEYGWRLHAVWQQH
jgi:hypothetical protein